MDEKSVINKWVDGISEEYENLPEEAKEKYGSRNDYLRVRLDRVHLSIEFKRNTALQREFGGDLQRFLAYMEAEKKGLIKIIGGKIIH